MSDLAGAFLAAADHAVAVLSRAEVAAAWHRPSALAEWSVGGLAAHLASEAPTAVRLLAAPPGEDPIPIEEHYVRVAWVGATLHDDVNVGIRADGDAGAAGGPEAVVARLADARAALPDLLSTVPADRAVLIPWQGWSLRRDDFLITRMMEIVVHAEDVAASVGTITPDLPSEVLVPVLRLLSGLAVRRHGQAAVVAAFTRSERAPRYISAF